MQTICSLELNWISNAISIDRLHHWKKIKGFVKCICGGTYKSFIRFRDCFNPNSRSALQNAKPLFFLAQFLHGNMYKVIKIAKTSINAVQKNEITFDAVSMAILKRNICVACTCDCCQHSQQSTVLLPNLLWQLNSRVEKIYGKLNFDFHFIHFCVGILVPHTNVMLLSECLKELQPI